MSLEMLEHSWEAYAPPRVAFGVPPKRFSDECRKWHTELVEGDGV